MSGTTRFIGMSRGSSPLGKYCRQVGATCAPAAISTSSTPSWRASRTPHACIDSPRTRSGNSTVASSTVTPRPSRASARDSDAPAIPPPTTTTSTAVVITNPFVRSRR